MKKLNIDIKKIKESIILRFFVIYNSIMRVTKPFSFKNYSELKSIRLSKLPYLVKLFMVKHHNQPKLKQNLNSNKLIIKDRFSINIDRMKEINDYINKYYDTPYYNRITDSENIFDMKVANSSTIELLKLVHNSNYEKSPIIKDSNQTSKIFDDSYIKQITNSKLPENLKEIIISHNEEAKFDKTSMLKTLIKSEPKSSNQFENDKHQRLLNTPIYERYQEQNNRPPVTLEQIKKFISESKFKAIMTFLDKKDGIFNPRSGNTLCDDLSDYANGVAPKKIMQL